MWGKCTSLGATSIHGQSPDWNAMHRRQSWCENTFMVQCTTKGFPHWQKQKVQRETDMKEIYIHEIQTNECGNEVRDV